MTQKSISDFISETNILAILDHSGRAGNGFVLTIFDQHPEVLCCCWLHYAYSYIVAEFGDSDEIPSEAAHAFWTEQSYFRFVYQDMNPEIEARLNRVGADVNVVLDRKLLRKTFDEYLQERSHLTRRELLLASYYAFAIASGRDTTAVQYIIVDDAVSLREEDFYEGFSGRVIDTIVKDFPDARLVSLVRDPRAAFASTTHQFINEYGNPYGYTPKNYLSYFTALLRNKIDQGQCILLYVWLYCAAAARVVYDLKRRYPAHFYTLRNEDLNLDFIPSISTFCSWLGVQTLPEWNNDPYEPTMMGKPWGGTGAYNNKYYGKKTFGPLANDANEVAKKVTGPNRYVTTRWRSKLLPSEIQLCEVFYREEMEDLEYEFLYPKTKAACSLDFILPLLRPFRAELPTLSWILSGRKISLKVMAERIFYAFTFPPFYLASRIVLYRMAVHRGFFRLGEVTSPRQKVE